MTIITIPKILREKLTEEGAEALVGILDKVEEQSEAHTLQIAEERFEKKVEQAQSDLKEDISDSKVELLQEIHKFGAELKDNISKVDTRLEQAKSDLKQEISDTKVELLQEIHKFRSELKDDISKVDKRLEQTKSELREEISKVDNRLEQVRADIIKWMFIFWVGQVITITGILIAFLKK